MKRPKIISSAPLCHNLQTDGQEVYHHPLPNLVYCSFYKITDNRTHGKRIPKGLLFPRAKKAFLK